MEESAQGGEGKKERAFWREAFEALSQGTSLKREYQQGTWGTQCEREGVIYALEALTFQVGANRRKQWWRSRVPEGSVALSLEQEYIRRKRKRRRD